MPATGGVIMKNKYTRRQALELGLGAAALGVAGTAISAAQTAQKPGPAEGNSMSSLSAFNKYGEDLENSLVLRTSPIALKMLETEADIPKEAFRPKKDGGYNIAQCQAFGMSRREGKTVAMLKEDHRCPTAPLAYGIVGKPDSMAMYGESFASFEVGKYVGMVTAPLKKCHFYARYRPHLFESGPNQGIDSTDDDGRQFQSRHTSLPPVLWALRRGSHDDRKLLRRASGSRGVPESSDVGRRDDIRRTAGKDAGTDGRLAGQGQNVLPPGSIHVHASQF